MCFRSYVFTANGNTFLTSSRIAFLIVYPHEVKVWLAQQFPSKEIFEVLLCMFTPEQCRAFQIDQTWGWPNHCCHSCTMECGNRQPLAHRIHCRPVLNATIHSIAYNLQNMQILRCCTMAKIIITVIFPDSHRIDLLWANSLRVTNLFAINISIWSDHLIPCHLDSSKQLSYWYSIDFIQQFYVKLSCPMAMSLL